MFTLFQKKEKFFLPEFSVRAEGVRATIGTPQPKELVKILIEVAKVWTYDYEERASFIQELFESLPKKSQESFLDFVQKTLPESNPTKDFPHAICQIQKEKLEEVLLLIG